MLVPMRGKRQQLEREETASLPRMLVAWGGVAALAASWLPGLGYYQPADFGAWLALVILGLLALAAAGDDRGADGGQAWRSRLPAGLLALTALFVAPWPYAAGILAFAVGNLLAAATWKIPPRMRRTLRRLSASAVVGGTILLAQAITVNAYAVFTSRSHELPPPLPWLLGTVTSLLGIESAVEGNTVALHSMREVHRLGATWELFFDPVTCAFLTGALVLLALHLPLAVNRRRRAEFVRSADLVRSALALGWILLAWLPLRAGLLVAAYLEDVLRTQYDAPLDAMRLFWSPWVHGLLLAGPVLIMSLLGPRLRTTVAVGRPRSEPRQQRRAVAAVLACFTAAGLVTWGLFWDPIGTRGQGRVVVEEYHPEPSRIWEPTGRPYDTNWYGQEAGYNYACIYDYCGKFYRMSRCTSPLTRPVLESCDVLVLKVPTRPYSAAEIDEIVEFVRRGGGLLLIAEHTNVFRTSDSLHPVAERFGIRFREDCLFGINSVFKQHYVRPLLPHPIVQHVKELDFATSCSIAPIGNGRAAIRSWGLKSAMADYHATNFYPQPRDEAAMRYGAFVQLWTTRYGRGRVVAFSDSTIFSNFCVFDEGKSELMLGMLEWANHRGGPANPRPWLVVLAALLLAVSIRCAALSRMNWTVLAACGLAGWAAAVVLLSWSNRQAMPPPAARENFVQVVLDRTLCDTPLSRNGFLDPSGDGFGMFAQWMLRLGYFTARRQGADGFDADLLVLLAPTRAPSEHYLKRLEQFVEGGGRVLILDDPRRPCTTGGIARRFGITVDPQPSLQGTLRSAADWPAVSVERARRVEGGAAFAWLGDQPVAARARRGTGTVAVVGFGDCFRDRNMGASMDTSPDAAQRRLYELEFALVRWLME